MKKTFIIEIEVADQTAANALHTTLFGVTRLAATGVWEFLDGSDPEAVNRWLVKEVTERMHSGELAMR